MPAEFHVIGKAVPDKAAYLKATGAAKYVDDLPADLHVKILRCPHAHAMITDIDVSAAQELPGVAAVITYRDVPDRLMPRGSARPVLILDQHLRHPGDEVAAVAAETEAIAEEALELIAVEYELLPAVFDPIAAAAQDAPRIHPDGNVCGFEYEQGINEPAVLICGDIEKGFAEADVVIEASFEVAPQLHTPIEPHVCIASWTGGDLLVETATQTPWEVRDGLANLFELPDSRVRVLSPYIGGGFGGKYANRYQPIAALLSKKAGGRRTKIRLTREEEQCHGKRSMHRQFVKLGAKRDGTMVAARWEAYADLGGYGSFEGNSGFWGEYPSSQYVIPNVKCVGWDVNTNHYTSQPMRGVEVPPTVFGFESAVDMLAEKLGMDPAEFRLKNMAQTGDTTPPTPYSSDPVGYGHAELEGAPSKKLMAAVMEKLGWKNRWRGWDRPVSVDGSKRRGMAIVYGQYDGGYMMGAYTSMAAIMAVDGSLTILSGMQDIGTSLNTALCQLAGEYMGLPLEQVSIQSGDTNTGQYDFYGAKASRSATIGGHVLMLALADLKRKVCTLAAGRLGCKPDELDLMGKTVYNKEEARSGRWSCWRTGCTLHKSIAVSDLLTSAITGSAHGEPTTFAGYLPGKKLRNSMVAGGEVEVDMATGEVKVLRVVTGNCPGVAINPEVVLGQYQGGAAMALGYALWEDWKFDESKSVYLNDSLTDYRIPRMIDLPDPEALFLEVPTGRSPEEGAPFGVQGVGELGAWFGPALIACAIRNATGVRVTRNPLTAETVFAAIQERGSD